MSRVSFFNLLALLGIVAWGSDCWANSNDARRIPVREVTVFKDGHSFVVREGAMATDADGDVVLDEIPAPVMGTFWAYSGDENVELKAVVAGETEVDREQINRDLRELLAANVGAEVLVTEEREYTATIVSVPSMEEEKAGEINGGELQDVVLLRTAAGIKVVNIRRIRDVTFLGEPKLTRSVEETRELMTLRLDWGEKAVAEKASVGLAYVQKGIRWIPSYKVTIDGEGKAIVKLQATLLNELTDLDDTTVHLVVGVPSFAFADLTDPISLQKTVAQLSQHFQRNDQRSMFHNAIMSQVITTNRPGDMIAPSEPAPSDSGIDLGPEIPGANKHEDLYVFTVENVTLKKGERMVMPICEFPLTYEDVYKLDVPFVPPYEVRRQFNGRQQDEMAKLLRAPTAMHVLRLLNDSPYPLTTAPAVVFDGDRLLGQGLIRYTSHGARCDLEVTTAVDIHAVKTEEEVNRDPNAVRWDNTVFGKIDVKGQISVTSSFDHPVRLEVERHVLGNIDKASGDGKIRMDSVGEAEWNSSLRRTDWWYWYSWPYWWHHFNGSGTIKWSFELEAGKQVGLEYGYHYYWR